MKNLHSFAFYALATPVITLGAGPLLAQQSTDQDVDRQQEQSTQQQSTQRDQDAKQSTTKSMESDQSTSNQSGTQNRGYMGSAPANGMHASNLIGAEVKTSADEDVGPVSDLIIDKNGQVVAIVVGVGGFLGMGERSVAIGWDDVTKSGTSDEPELRIDVTRESLRSAPEFKTRD